MGTGLPWGGYCAVALEDFAAAVEAILTGPTYVHVHSTLFIAGELRGQVRAHEKGLSAKFEARI